MSQTKVFMIMFGSIFLFTSAWIISWAMFYRKPAHQTSFSSRPTIEQHVGSDSLN